MPEWAEKTPELQRIDDVIEELEQQPELGEPSMCASSHGLGLHGAILQNLVEDGASRYAIRRAMEWRGIDLFIVDTSLKDGYVSYEIAVSSDGKQWTVWSSHKNRSMVFYHRNKSPLPHTLLRFIAASRISSSWTDNCGNISIAWHCLSFLLVGFSRTRKLQVL